MKKKAPSAPLYKNPKLSAERQVKDLLELVEALSSMTAAPAQRSQK